MKKEELIARLKSEFNVDVSALIATAENYTVLQKEKKELENKIKELSNLPAKKEQEIDSLKKKILEITNTMRISELENSFDKLIKEGKLVPAQKEFVLKKFESSEELETFYSSAPTVVNITPQGSQDESFNELTAEEKALVDDGSFTKEEIIANRTIDLRKIKPAHLAAQKK